MKNIPQQRLILYILILGLLPLFFVASQVWSKMNAFEETQATVRMIYSKALVLEKKQTANLSVKNHYREADHFYIDKHLETLSFLNPEVESLQKIASSQSFMDDDVVKKRLEFLTGPANTLIFTEGVVQSYAFFQETMESLVHPVEVNAQDLQKILVLIEGVEIPPFKPTPNRPQLLITDIKLDKKSLQDKNEVYTLNLKLLKREFL